MLGVVFTEFVECMESEFGMAVADRVQSGCPFHTAFTAVDNYDHNHLLTLVERLQKETGTSSSVLVHHFGRHIFQSFLRSKPGAFEGVHSTPELLRKVQSTIHGDVLSLYPNAELPEFTFPCCPQEEFHFEYRSNRPFADLAHGILEASIAHYRENWNIRRVDLDGPVGTHALFILVHAS